MKNILSILFIVFGLFGLLVTSTSLPGAFLIIIISIGCILTGIVLIVANVLYKVPSKDKIVAEKILGKAEQEKQTQARKKT
ncbi:hypothetical protein [Ktedonospora formicarum]|uniref:Uncharacterized protein n=1 Tax=Ktedonospora formicarum TaxID=2778364 RepID=A0A8J3ID73_9CHLR|nr:hypothetical protein [Ktedonospora formicarum]GHO49194.1 hypothetical protein KSX_73570 [Ktedonospora formicarum]